MRIFLCLTASANYHIWVNNRRLAKHHLCSSMQIIYANDEYPLGLFALQVVSVYVLRRRKRKKHRTNLIITAVSCQLRLIESRYLSYLTVHLSLSRPPTFCNWLKQNTVVQGRAGNRGDSRDPSKSNFPVKRRAARPCTWRFNNGSWAIENVNLLRFCGERACKRVHYIRDACETLVGGSLVSVKRRVVA